MKNYHFRNFALIVIFAFFCGEAWATPKAPNTSPLAPASVSKNPAHPDLVQAKDIIQEAAKKYPKNAELQMQLGFIFKRMDRYEDARRAFQEAVKIDPRLVEGDYMLGLIYEYRKETKKALNAWQECLTWASDPEMKNTAAMHLHHLDPSFVVKSKKP